MNSKNLHHHAAPIILLSAALMLSGAYSLLSDGTFGTTGQQASVALVTRTVSLQQPAGFGAAVRMSQPATGIPDDASVSFVVTAANTNFGQ